MTKSIAEVENFWNNNLCGNHFIKSKFPSKEFFEEYRIFRYKKTHHLDEYIDWKEAKGKNILEVGLGIGADASRWAQYAKEYTGVDLTEESIYAVKKHFEYLGLKGRIIKDNVESLNLPDKYFDITYSHGVLHHTKNITKAFDEINRVLKPEGKFIVMLYAKESFNYWIRIQFYFRARVLYELLKKNMGLSNKGIWEEHVTNVKKRGLSYLGWNEFPHHCTDGPNCEIAYIFSKKDMYDKLENAGFIVEKNIKAHFPMGGKFPKLERAIGSAIGFHRIIWCKKKS